jgi:biotin-dependent carboxylase-like uncharacterized protein
MIEILSESALATVQDLGRKGALGWGVGTSGAMDPMALAAGNLMLGNPADAAAIEIQIFPFQVRFSADCAFAVTGADTPLRLDAADLPPWWCERAAAGQILRVGVPKGNAPHRGSRAYLCLAGGVDVPVVLDSRSTQLRGSFGGHEGRTLRRGDRLAVGRSPTTRPAGFGLVPASIARPMECGGLPALRVLPAAEYGCFTEAARTAFWGEPWTITPQSDRYGYRLAGPALATQASLELRSHGIVPGVIQVPPGGQPIVQMRDAQPSGGYPKIGTVIEADLWRLGQAPIGARVRFLETSWDEAIGAGEENAAWLASVGRLVELHAARPGGR